jgi:hypothetical protein
LFLFPSCLSLFFFLSVPLSCTFISSLKPNTFCSQKRDGQSFIFRAELAFRSSDHKKIKKRVFSLPPFSFEGQSLLFCFWAFIVASRCFCNTWSNGRTLTLQTRALKKFQIEKSKKCCFFRFQAQGRRILKLLLLAF